MRPVAVHRTLDVRGLSCPMPVVKANREMRELGPGQVLEILATDRGSLTDIPAWARDRGHEVLEVHDGGPEVRFLIRKGDAG